MSVSEIILAVLTLLLGGTNIVTFVQLKSLRRKGNYEADGVRIANLQSIIDIQGEQITALSERLAKAEARNEEQRIKYESRIEELENRYNTLTDALRAGGIKLPTI